MKYINYILLFILILTFPKISLAANKTKTTVMPPKNFTLIPSKIFPASVVWSKNISVKNNIACLSDSSVFILSNDNSIYKINIIDGTNISLNDTRFKSISSLICTPDIILLTRKKDILTLDKNSYKINLFLELNSEITDILYKDNSIYILSNDFISVSNIITKNYRSFFLNQPNKYFNINLYKNDIIVFATDGLIRRYSPEGKLKWELNLKEKISLAGTLYDKVLYQPAGTFLFSIDLEKPKIKWKTLLGAASEFPPLISKDSIYIAPLNNILFCLDHKGNKRWVKLLNYKITTQMILLEDEIILSSFSEDITSLMSASGNLIGSYKQESPFLLKSFFINVTSFY